MWGLPYKLPAVSACLTVRPHCLIPRPQWCEDNIASLPNSLGVHPYYDDFTTPTFDGRHNFANALWARGNSWVTIVIPEFIELLNLPEGDAFRQFLVSTLEAQVQALAACQSASGLWPTLLDDPTSYDEAAASAGFAYGILKAVRRGYLPRSYEAVGLKAALAVRSKINDEGELTQVSFGTPVFNTLQEYKDIPLTSMPFGQAMALLAMGELLVRFI